RSTRSSPRGATSTPRTTGRAGSTAKSGRVHARCSSRTRRSGSAGRLRPRPPPIWIAGSGKPALRRVARVGDGWIPQATPPDRLADDIAFILRERDKVRPGAVPEVGYHAGVYVGKADWELPKFAMNGNDRIVDWINGLGAQGVSHVQVRFAARSADELCDQVTRFGEEIGPHLTRVALS